MTLFLVVISPEKFSDSLGQVGIESSIRRFYLVRKKGRSHPHALNPGIELYSI